MTAATTESASLAGHLLLAMPALSDPNFTRSVILLCEHTPQGALGLVVNRPLSLPLAQVLRQLELPSDNPKMAARVAFSGGPVETARGFVVHDAPGRFGDSVTIGEMLAVTASQEILDSIARGAGPARFLLLLGYAGWGPGQLERELADNAWLATPASPELIFDAPVAERWRRAAASIGVDLARLSSEAGHA